MDTTPTVEPRAALHDPDAGHDYYDEVTGDGREPFVRWDLAFGCAVTIGRDDDGGLSASVSTSDASGNGHERRRVTDEQVAAYARHLLALVERAQGGDAR